MRLALEKRRRYVNTPLHSYTICRHFRSQGQNGKMLTFSFFLPDGKITARSSFDSVRITGSTAFSYILQSHDNIWTIRQIQKRNRKPQEKRRRKNTQLNLVIYGKHVWSFRCLMSHFTIEEYPCSSWRCCYYLCLCSVRPIASCVNRITVPYCSIIHLKIKIKF